MAGVTQGQPASTAHIIQELQRRNDQLQAANAGLLARLQALEARVAPDRVQYATAAARARAPDKSTTTDAEWPALGAGAEGHRRQTKQTSMYTEVARRARPQFQATQYVAGGAPGQRAQAVKNSMNNKVNRGYEVVQAPPTSAVPLQPVGSEVLKILRTLDITAYQSAKAYSEQERKVDMAPAAPIRPGKPVVEWDTESKPEQHRRVLVVGLELQDAHQLAADAMTQHPAVEMIAAVVQVPGGVARRGCLPTVPAALRAAGADRPSLMVAGTTMDVEIAKERGLWMDGTGGPPFLPKGLTVLLTWRRAPPEEIEAEELRKTADETKSEELAAAPSPPPAGQALMVLTLDPAALRPDQEDRDGKRPRALPWAREQARQLMRQYTPTGSAMGPMDVKRAGPPDKATFMVELWLPVSAAIAAMRACGTSPGWGIRPHIGEWAVDPRLEAKVMRVKVPDAHRRSIRDHWLKMNGKEWFAGIAPPDTWFKGDKSLAVRRWGSAPVSEADLAAVADCLGFKVPPSKSLIRVRGYGIMFGTNESIVRNEMARVFSSGAPALQLVGFSHVQASGRRSPTYVVEVTGLPESWPGARLMDPGLHEKEKVWERMTPARAVKTYTKVQTGARLQEQKKPEVDQSVPLPDQTALDTIEEQEEDMI
jgi:hypothetical protein